MGSTFNPGARSGSGSGEHSNELVPSGDRLLVITWLQLRKVEASDTRRHAFNLARVKVEVVGGEYAGRSFFTAITLNQRSDGAMARLDILCKSAGITESFDLDSERSVAKALKNKPFKARVEQKQEIDRRDNSERTVNDIARFIPKLSEEEKRIAAGWVLDREESRAARGQSDDDFEDGGTSTSGGGGGTDKDEEFDDVPFD